MIDVTKIITAEMKAVAREDSEARATLARLDAKVPRGVEDLLIALESALNIDLRSHLPAATRAILDEKIAARAKVRS
jgi:hypothetical protein